MAGKKRRRKAKPIAKTVRDRSCPINAPEKEDGELELVSWSDLPTELLQPIFSRLTLKENIRTSAVCKRWRIVALSVRVTNQAPWIMYFPKSGILYDFYNPSTRKTYSVKLGELSGARVCYTKDGWLVMYRASAFRPFFFNPFTWEMIKLPRLMPYQIVAFSCAPTDSACVVFMVKHISPTVVAITTWCPGAAQWSTSTYQNRLPFVSSIWNKMAFCNGLFYCLSLTGWLGVFDPRKLTWNVLAVPPPPRCFQRFIARNWWKGKFMAEHNKEIFLIYACGCENPTVFKLAQSATEWEQVVSLDDVTLFASLFTSHSRTDLSGAFRNRIFFPKVRYHGQQCISYSLRDKRYYPRKQCHHWGEQDPSENIWIDPPENPSSFTARRALGGASGKQDS